MLTLFPVIVDFNKGKAIVYKSVEIIELLSSIVEAEKYKFNELTGRFRKINFTVEYTIDFSD